MSELFEVRVETSFEAAHRRDPQGVKVPLHHHLWRVAVRARARQLDPIGIVVDFRRLRAASDEAIADLDQRVLEELPAFDDRAATPETVAAELMRRLQAALPDERFWLHSVEVDCGPEESAEVVGERR